MEETVINEPSVQSVEQPREEMSPVSFPSNAPRKKGGFGKVIIIFLGLAILGVIGFLVFKGVGGGDAEPTATPSVESISGSSDTLGSESEATPTPEPVDKSDVSIKVMNGTGISGEAGFLQDALKSLDYTKIEVGNASSQDNTVTMVTFASDLSKEIVDEITAKLESLYKEVTAKTSSTLKTVDVEITTGLRKGATPKPSASATPKPSASASPSSSPSGSPTSTTTP